jgi:deaminated glutathione amidase
MVVAPWGEVIAAGGTEPGITYAEIDLAAVERARRRIPSLMHDRPFEGP